MSGIVRTDFTNNVPPSPNAGYLNHLGQVVNSKVDRNFRFPIIEAQTPTNIANELYLVAEHGRVVGTEIEILTEALSPVAIISVTSGNRRITLRWRDPVDSQWSHTMLVRKIGSHPVDEHDGVVVMTNTVRNQYQTTGFVDDGLIVGTRYYYRFVPVDLRGARNMSPANLTQGTPGMPIRDKSIGDDIYIRIAGTSTRGRVIHREVTSPLYRGFANTVLVMLTDNNPPALSTSPHPILSGPWTVIHLNQFPYPDYSTSEVHVSRQHRVMNSLTRFVRDRLAEVRIPYYDPITHTILSGNNGLLCRAFVPSLDEVGIRAVDLPSMTILSLAGDTAPLGLGNRFDFFLAGIGAEATERRRRMPRARNWLRSPIVNPVFSLAVTIMNSLETHHVGGANRLAPSGTVGNNTFTPYIFAFKGDTLVDVPGNIIDDDFDITELRTNVADFGMAFDAFLEGFL